MRKGIHPDYYLTKFTDITSGRKFIIGSTVEEMNVEISSASHPFYTGEARIIDTENRVDSFQRKQEMAKTMKDKVQKKKAKKIARRVQKVEKINATETLTLKDMLKNIQ